MSESGAARSVLVVDPTPEAASTLVSLLQAAGYDAVGTMTFESARGLLESRPDLLISALRLGAFNGLHLVLHGHYLNPDMAAMVVADRYDTLLAGEAAQRGVAYVVKPLLIGPLLALISRLVAERPRCASVEYFAQAYRERRQHERRRSGGSVGRERRVADRRQWLPVGSALEWQ